MEIPSIWGINMQNAFKDMHACMHLVKLLAWMDNSTAFSMGWLKLFMDIVYHPKSKALDLECIKELVFQSLDIWLFVMIH